MLFCLGLSGRITQISNILCASASLREKSADEFRFNGTMPLAPFVVRGSWFVARDSWFGKCRVPESQPGPAWPSHPHPTPTPLPEQTTKKKGLWLHSATRSQATILYFAFTSGPLARTRALTRGGGGEAPEARRQASSAARSSAQAQDANRS